MLEEETNTQAEEVTEPEETVNDNEEDAEETEEEETIGDSVEEKKPIQIPKSRLDKEIKRRKELEKQLEESKQKETNSPDLEARLAAIEKEKEVEALNAKLDLNLNKALEEAPEFSEVINRDIFKQLALLPQNKDKTYLQLLEETYGNAVKGKTSTERTVNRGGTNSGKVDMQRAHKDKEYFKEVMANPTLRDQYNELLIEQGD